MSILSDVDLLLALREGEIRVGKLTGREEPGGAIQPASIDLTLGTELLGFPRAGTGDVIDPERPPEMEPRGWRSSYAVVPGEDERDYYPLQYGEMILASTAERIGIGRSVVGAVEGKSTLGRLGLFVHITAHYIDPGWGGHAPMGGAPITLELLNMAPGPILLRPGMKIAQLVVYRASRTSALGYGNARLGSHYADSAGPVGARADQSWQDIVALDGAQSPACTGTVIGSRVLGCGSLSCPVHGEWLPSDGIGLGAPRERRSGSRRISTIEDLSNYNGD